MSKLKEVIETIDMRQGLFIDNSNNKFYYLNDKLHREDGPAVEWYDGHKSWWIYNKYIGSIEGGMTQELFSRLLKLKAFW